MDKLVKPIIAFFCVLIIFFLITYFYINSETKESESYKYAISVIENDEQVLKITGGIESFGFFGRSTRLVRYSRDNGELGEYVIPINGKKNNLTVKIRVRREKEGDWAIEEFKLR